jgi:hypothetical protein
MRQPGMTGLSSACGTSSGSCWTEPSNAANSPPTDYQGVLDLLFGAAQHRPPQGHQPLTDIFARRIVDIIMAEICRP